MHYMDVKSKGDGWYWVLIIGLVLLVGSLSYGAYTLAKKVNYSFMYEDMVRETVREMVKDEALK
jgi:hypothetical protein